MARILLERGADVTVANDEGLTPLHALIARRVSDESLLLQLLNLIKVC